MKRLTRSFRLPPALPAVVAAIALLAVAVPPARAQQAKLTVNKDCTAFAFSPDGSRIVYAVRQVSEERVSWRDRVRVEHDDIWQVTLDGHEHRLVNGRRLVKSRVRVGFKIQAIRIGPNGKHMTVQMLTRTLFPGPEGSKGRVVSGELIDLMDAKGKEINIYGTKPKNSAIFDVIDAAWLLDGETVVYLRQPKGSLLYQLGFVRPAGGRGGAILPHHYYAAVAWSPAHNGAAAIERNKDLKGPIHLVWVDLIKQTQHTLTTLKGFSGHLTVSPSGKQIAYFSAGNTIAIRSVADPDKVIHIKAPFGRYEWSADGTHLLLKIGTDDQSGKLIWIDVASGKHQDAFQGQEFHSFHISPDGKWVGVIEPGSHALKLLPLP